MEAAFAIIRQLRNHLDFEVFCSRVERQRHLSYHLLGAFSATLIAVAGVRDVATLARGDHLHIDDLVVDQNFRRRGVGTTMLTYIERWGLERNRPAIFLDSRPEVINFYKSLGYEPHSATLMRKRVIAQQERGICHE